MLKSKMSTAESFIALGGIIVGFTTCFIAGAPRAPAFYTPGVTEERVKVFTNSEGILPKCLLTKKGVCCRI